MRTAARLGAAAGTNRLEASSPAVSPLDGTVLIESIEELAKNWHKRSWQRLPSSDASGVMTPEELTQSAAERGLDVRFEQRRLASLEARDMPCVALTKDGRGLILAQRQGKYFNLWKQGLTDAVPVQALAERYAGVVFFVEPSGGMDAPAMGQSPAEASLARLVLDALMTHHRRALLMLALAAIVGNLFLVALPVFSMAVYDRVVPHLAYETLWALSIGVSLVLAGDMAIRIVRLKLADAVSFSVSIRLQARLYARVLQARLGTNPVATGTLSNALRDIEGMCQCVPALIVALVVDLPWFLATAVLIYGVAGAVAWTPAIGVALLLLVHLWGHFTRGRSLASARLAALQTNQANEALGALEAIKTTTAERVLLRRWETLSDQASFASHRSRLANGAAVQASVVIGQAMIVVALVIGVYEMGNHAISVGGLSAATLLVGRMMGPASQLMGLLHRVSELQETSKSALKILSAPQENVRERTATSSTGIAGHIELRDLSFTYPGEKAPALSAITATIRPGERIGIIGRIGCGKSTLLRLLVRLYEPSEGAVTLDGHDMRQYSEREVRQALGFMRQDSVLFDDTLQANLCYGLGAVAPAEFEAAVALAGVRDFASRHPDGYGMRVGQRGDRLSGGERQAVALARVLLGSRRVVLLDEPTAAMDNGLEARVVRELGSAVGPRTLVVATHRAPLLALVDRILWLDNGRVVADGPRAEVLARIQSASTST